MAERRWYYHVGIALLAWGLFAVLMPGAVLLFVAGEVADALERLGVGQP